MVIAVCVLTLAIAVYVLILFTATKESTTNFYQAGRPLQKVPRKSL